MQNNAQFGEKEMLDDLLNSHKHTAETYTTAITESSCENMRQMLSKNLQQCCQDQYDVFDRMRTMGFYDIKQADTNEVNQATQKYGQIQQQL